MSHRARLAALAVLIAPPTAQAFPVETLRNSGPAASRIDIAVLGDGYTASEQGKLTTNAQALRAALFGVTPYQEYAGLFNVKLVHVPSNQSGADNGSAGGLRDTALDAAYNCQGIDYLICIDNAAALGIAAADVPEYDFAITLVNDSKYGGSGGVVPVVSTATSAAEILRHEFSHRLGLADEYETPYPGYPLCSAANDCTEPNATLRSARAQAKWRDWIDLATPVPTPESSGYDAIGVFEGGRYLSSGIYRPKDSGCRMKELDSPFCSVCAEGLVREIYNHVAPIDAVSPASPLNPSTCAPITFSVTTPSVSPSYWTFSWRVDGALQTASAGSFVVQPSALGAGAHTIQVTVSDATPLVRSDPEQLLQDTRRWDLTVPACAVDAGAPDSRPDGALDGGTPDAPADGARDASADSSAGNDAATDGGDGDASAVDASVDATGPNDAAGQDAASTMDSGLESGAAADAAGARDAGATPPPPAPGETVQCSCDVPGKNGGTERATLLLVALAAVLARKRTRTDRSRLSARPRFRQK